MTTPVTITKPQTKPRTKPQTKPPAGRRKLPGWLWFVLLWCAGVAGAVSLGYAFKILMNVTLFAVK